MNRPSALLPLASALVLVARLAFAQAAPAPKAPAAAPPKAPAVKEKFYDLRYDVRIVPTKRSARVTIRVESPEDLVRSIGLDVDPQRFRDFQGDGKIEVTDKEVRWYPPAGTASLRYQVGIDHLRDQRYDARCAEDWAIFRGEDLVPPGRVDFEDGARSRAQLRLRVPEGWKIAAPYRRLEAGIYEVDDPRRAFDRPKGWFAVGRLGVVRETVAGVHVAIAGPVGQKLRRVDVLAMLRWTLPQLRKILDPPLPRLLVVGAGDPMWRGGLSGPNSLFLHADRPLITPDITSPLLHELMHTVLGIRPAAGGDWIVEGLPELYSLELLVRSGTISRKRFDRALDKLRQRGRGVRNLEVDQATGPVTARAVTVLRALDATLRQRSKDARSLDDVLRILAKRQGEVGTASLRAAAEEVAGGSLSDFFLREVGRSKAKP